MAIIQVWTAPKAQSGAECIGVISHVIAGRVQEAGSTQNTVRLTVEKTVADAAGVSVGRWLWISHPWRGVTEWAVLQVNRADGRSRDTVEIIAGSLRQALALRGTIRTVNAVGPITTTFAAQSLPVASLLSLYFFTNQAADGLEWISPGVVAYQGAIKVGPITNWTRAQLLDEIEKATGYAFEFVRSGDVGYRLDLVRTRGDSAETVLLDAALNLNELAEAADLLASPTVIEPRTSSGLPMGETWWTVGSISGSGPFWVTLRDPANGPAVIREDDQVNGWYLRANDGVPVGITDSRASDSAVEVASVEGLLVGGLATLWASEDGALSPEITSPSGVTARGRAVQSISVSINSTDANRITDPTLRNALGLWEVRNPTAGGADVFGRNDPKTIPLVINGAVSGGATSITVDGGHPDSVDAVLRFGDAIAVDGVSVNSTANVVPTATGGATVPVSPSLPSTIADAVQLAWTRGDAVIGTVVTSGTQSSGASSLVLTGLPAQPQVTAGDQFVLSGQVSATLVPGQLNPLPASITSGTAVQIIETRIRVSGTFAGLQTVVSYASTVTSTAATGAAVNVDLSGAPSLPGDQIVLFRTFTVTQTQTVRTYTITGTPAAWSGTGTGTFNISGTIGQSITNETQLAWLRAGARLGFVKLTSARVTADNTLPLQLQSLQNRVLSGDTFTLPAQTLYCGANMTLSGTGTGTIPLRVAAAGIADNTPVTVQRCRDYQDDEMGSGIVLRLRGNNTAAPVTYLGGSEFALYSPIFRIDAPADAASIFGRYGITSWAPQDGQRGRLYATLWDVDTGTALNAGINIDLNPIPFQQNYELETVSAGGGGNQVAISGTRRYRLSLHPGGGEVGNSPGAFVFLRWLGLGVVDNDNLSDAIGTKLLPFVVDGGASNALWHRGQDVIETASNSTRYRATLNGAPQDGTAPLVFGGKVRVRSEALGTDRTLRITRLDWSLEDDGDVALELGALTPRLSES